MPFMGGPRDGEDARLADEVFVEILRRGGAYLAHLRSDWVDGEDAHLPVDQQMRALYLYVPGDEPRFQFLKVASMQRITDAMAKDEWP